MLTLSRRILSAAVLLALPGAAHAQNPIPTAAATTSKFVGVPAVTLAVRTTLEAPNRQAVVDEDFVFKATFAVLQPGQSPSGQSVTFKLAGAFACFGTTDASGAVACHAKIPHLPQTFHTYTAEYKGGGTWLSSKAEAKLLVGKAQTKLVVNAPADAAPGKTVEVAVSLQRTLDNTGIDGKAVSLRLNGADAGVVTTVGGGGHKTVTIPASATGVLKLDANFAGDDFYVASSASDSITVNRKAYIGILAAQGGIVGAQRTYKVQVAKVPLAPGMQVPSAGIAGVSVRFSTCRGLPNGGDCYADDFLGDATTDANGYAEVTRHLEHVAARLKVSAFSAGGWEAQPVSTPMVVTKARTVVTAPPVTGAIGKNAVVKVRASRLPDDKGRAGAEVKVTKIDQTTFPTPFKGLTVDGDVSIAIPVSSQWGIGTHTLTVEVGGDYDYEGATKSVPFTVQPSQ